MVLHALDVAEDHVLGQLEKAQQLGEQFVAVGDAGCDGFTGVGEDHAAVFLVFHQAVGVEALDHGGDAGLGDLELGGDIDHPRVALGFDEGGDALQVVLGGGGGDSGRGRRGGAGAGGGGEGRLAHGKESGGDGTEVARLGDAKAAISDRGRGAWRERRRG